MVATILVYGTDWCYDCRRARQFLKSHDIPFQWIDIDQDKLAEQYVIQINHGMRSVPTILFEDGATLTEPSNAQLSLKLGLVAANPSAR
jgi:mycoredoxin